MTTKRTKLHNRPEQPTPIINPLKKVKRLIIKQFWENEKLRV